MYTDMYVHTYVRTYVFYFFYNLLFIISYFNWVAISLRLLLRPPVSHALTHTHNQIKSNANCLVAAVGHLLSCSQVGGGGGVQGKKLQIAHRWSGAFCSNA